MICSSCCGAAVHLLKNNFNGYTVKPDDVAGLAAAMGKMSSLDAGQLQTMAENGKKLAAQFHPAAWFSNLLVQLPSIGNATAVQQS